jgi:hypothetical protein
MFVKGSEWRVSVAAVSGSDASGAGQAPGVASQPLLALKQITYPAHGFGHLTSN